MGFDIKDVGKVFDKGKDAVHGGADDLKDTIFGRRTVLHEAPGLHYSSGPTKRRWKCRCVCGNEKVIIQAVLTAGKSRSCGCYKRDKKIAMNTTHGCSNGKGVNPKEYDVWSAMLQRCSNPKNKSYKNYGGRGVKVCERWRGREGFSAFLSDTGSRPSAQHTLERMDNNGDYSLENCQWASRKTQGNNTRRNRILSLNGTIQTLQQWADSVGVNGSTLASRLSTGKTLKEALSMKKWAKPKGAMHGI